MRDQLLEMGTQQLAFTHQEAKQFFDCRRRRRWNSRTAAACATKSKAGPPRCS
ncbi:hypothetical protein M8494_30470 [Serratia ureilytica]